MLIPLLVCLLVVGIVVDVISVWMKMRVNEELPEDRRLSWWSRDYRQVNRIYSEQHPDSILPNLNRYGGYLAMALFATIALAGILQRN
jgi:hypothetical protein